ncbi:MAG TPA: hypothetical protein VIL74_14460 [Pyrinomonadaceae bacterium]|jgi:hypothetical protein
MKEGGRFGYSEFDEVCGAAERKNGGRVEFASGDRHAGNRRAF